jgi:hypothetical protein
MVILTINSEVSWYLLLGYCPRQYVVQPYLSTIPSLTHLQWDIMEVVYIGLKSMKKIKSLFKRYATPYYRILQSTNNVDYLRDDGHVRTNRLPNEGLPSLDHDPCV